MTLMYGRSDTRKSRMPRLNLAPAPACFTTVRPCCHGGFVRGAVMTRTSAWRRRVPLPAVTHGDPQPSTLRFGFEAPTPEDLAHTVSLPLCVPSCCTLRLVLIDALRHTSASFPASGVTPQLRIWIVGSQALNGSIASEHP